MAIGPDDPFGSLDASDDWKDREAQAGLALQQAAQPTTWADRWEGLGKVLPRLGRGLAGMANAPVSDESAMMPETYANPLASGLFNAAADTVKSGVTSAGDALTGKLPMYDENGHINEEVIRRAFDTAALAGGGALVTGRAAAAPSAAAAKAAGLEVVPERAAGASVAAPAVLASDTAPGAVAAVTEHAAPFYSPTEAALGRIEAKQMTGQAWQNQLKRYGAKPEEMDWNGLTDLLSEERGGKFPIPREAIEQHLEQNPTMLQATERSSPPFEKLSPERQDDVVQKYNDDIMGNSRGNAPRYSKADAIDWYETHRDEGDLADYFPDHAKFDQYKLPSRVDDDLNYRERLLHLPSQDAVLARAKQLGEEENGPGSWDRIGGGGQAHYVRDATRELGPRQLDFVGEHWTEPNVVVHRRTTDREFPEPATPEDQQQNAARQAGLEQLQNIRASQGQVGMQIRQAARPLERARQDQVMADIRSGKISGAEGARQLEQYGDHPELKPLQDRLQQLRAQESDMLRNLPNEVQPRTTPSMHIEEMQSDWHQQGRQKGYGKPDLSKFKATTSEGGSYYHVTDGNGGFIADISAPSADEALAHARQYFAEGMRGRVPHGPFKETWPTLAARDAVREAAEKGYPRISWTAGEEQPTNPLVMIADQGRTIGDNVFTDEGRATMRKNDASLRDFYNNRLVNIFNKIGKQHGVSVKEGALENMRGVSGGRIMDSLGIPEAEQRAYWENLGHEGRENAREDYRKKGIKTYYMDIPQSLRDEALSRGFPLFEDSTPGAAAAVASHTGEANAERAVSANAGGSAGSAGGGSGLEEAQRASARAAGAVKPLPGLPQKPVILNGEPFIPGPIGRIHDVAKQYMESVGRPYERTERYIPADVEHSTAIAKAFDEMKHEPDNPRVKASYEALAKETLAQYQAIKKSGLKIEPIGATQPDPYASNPRLAARDVAENNHLWFFPTEQGFGAEKGASSAEHPMLRPSGETLNGKPLLNNDLFRVVHDYFGHLKEGNGFRASGEDNAWRAHSKMYSDEAKPAMTSETRGQNSWVNYGPYGETNRTASAADTHYSEQKVGLMPDWTMTDKHPALFEDTRAASASAIAARAAGINDVPRPGAKYPQYAEAYPPVGPPQLMDKTTNKPLPTKGKAAQKLVDQGKAYWAKQNTPEAEAFQKDRSKIQKDMEAQGYQPFFPPEERSHVDPANHPTSIDTTRDALPAKQETIDKYTKQFNTPAARKRLQAAFDAGKKLGNAKDWYAMRQLEDQYVKQFGPQEGRERFANEFAHTMAATTGGSDPTSNFLLAHYVQWAAKNGHEIPAASHQLPFPIGGRYVGNNIKQFQKMPEQGGFTEANPKRHDFGHAFLGHANKATMDEQMSGGLVPGMQIPPGDSYGIAAQVVHDLAAKNGVSPRDFQDIAWAGLKQAKVGKGFKYKGPMIQDINDSIERTHRLTGMPRNEIVQRGLVKKEIPLYAGSPVPFGALDAQDNQ